MFQHCNIFIALSWALTKILDMSLGEALGVFIQGSSPGGHASNLVVYWIGGVVDLRFNLIYFSTKTMYRLCHKMSTKPRQD